MAKQKIMRFLLLSSLLMLVVIFDTHASDFRGSDLTYRCLDSGRIEIKLVAYRNCASISWPASYSVKMSCGSTTLTVALTRKSIRLITPVCASYGTNLCNPPNTSGTGNGVEEQVYLGVIDLNKSPYNSFKKSGCCKITLSFQTSCCRNSSTTHSSSGFYTEASFDICKVACNSSPQFTNEPIAFLCCNQPFYFNNGAIDPDGDSLSYTLIPGLVGPSSSISYKSGFTSSYPMTPYCPGGGINCKPYPNASPPIGLFLDPNSGDLVFTPIKCDEVGVIVIGIKEFRKDSTNTYVLIGESRRDMEFQVLACPGNNPPTIDGPFNSSVCEGTEICYDVTTEDKVKTPPPPASAPPPDTVVISWNRGIPGATFKVVDTTAINQVGRFCWTPAIGTANDLPYTYTVRAKDDACPLNAITIRAFAVRVNPIAEAIRNIDTFACGKYAVESILANNFKAPPKYTWQLRDSTGKQIFDRKKAYFKSTGAFISGAQKDTIFFRSGGKYIIQHTINNKHNCPLNYYDTLVVPPMLEADLAFGPDTFACAGTTVVLKPKVLNSKPPITYEWNSGETTDQISVKLEPTEKFRHVYVEIIDKSGCKAWDSTTIFLKNNPKVKIGPDRRICHWDTIHLKCNDSLAYWDDPRDTFGKVLQGDTLLKQWYLNGATYTQDANITVKNEGIYVVKVIDSLGCFGSDTMMLHVNDTVKANAGADQTLCWNDLLKLKALGLDTAINKYQKGTYRWYDVTNPPTKKYLGTMETVSYNIFQTTSFLLELFITEDTTTCFNKDEALITINPLPTVKMPAPMSVCCDAGVINLRNFEDPNAKGGMWTCTKNPTFVSNQYIFETSKACGTATTKHILSYRYVHPTTGCVKNDSFEITVNPLPTVELRDGYFCQDKRVVNLKDDKIIKLPGNPSLGTQSWNCIDCKTYNWSNILKDVGSGFQNFILQIDEVTVPLGTKLSDTIKIEFIYRSNFGCYNRDTAQIAITKVPKIKFAGFPELCWDQGIVDLKKLSSVTPNDGYWYAYDTMPAIYRKASDLNIALNAGALQGDTLNTFGTPKPIYPNPYKYYMRYFHDRSGCPTFRDTILTINPLPEPKITHDPLLALTTIDTRNPYQLCETEGDFALFANPAGGSWSSPASPTAIMSNTFKPTQAIINTPFYIKYDFVSIKGCRGKDSIELTIEALPKIEILNADTSICRVNSGMMLPISAKYSNTSGIMWIPFGGGSVSSTTASNVNFTFTTNSDSVQSRSLYVQTLPGKACPFKDDLFTVTVHPLPKATLSVDNPNGCNPLTASITTVINNKVDPLTSKYEWLYTDGGTDDIQNPTHQYTKDGTNTATLKLTSAFGCDSTLKIDVDVYPMPVALFKPDPNNSTTAALPRFTFNNQSTINNVLGAFIAKNDWEFGDLTSTDDSSTKISPVFFYPADTGTYMVTLKVTTNHGCSDEFSYPVIIGPDILVYIPNAFSPDGGGPQPNDGFRAYVNDAIKDYHMIIFNRWGQLMFETTDKNAKWDGTYKGVPCKQDVYAYYLDVTSWNGNDYEYSGTVTLIR